MQPEVLNPQALAKNLCPAQHGLYEVTVDRDTELQLFDELANEVEQGKGRWVWNIHVTRAVMSLNDMTGMELRTLMGTIPVTFTCTINGKDTWEVRVLTPAEYIVGLTPILP